METGAHFFEVFVSALSETMAVCLFYLIYLIRSFLILHLHSPLEGDSHPFNPWQSILSETTVVAAAGG